MAAINHSALLIAMPKSQWIVGIRGGLPAGAPVWNRAVRSQHVRAPVPINAQQVVLGQALSARISEVSRMTAEAAAAAGLFELASRRFAKQIHDVHNLTTRAVARFLITGQGTTETERNFIGRLGVVAARCGLPIATLIRSYILWRDTNLRVLREEVCRLGIPPPIHDQARMIIRSSADSGIMRLAEAYDHHTAGIGGRDDPAIGRLERHSDDRVPIDLHGRIT